MFQKGLKSLHGDSVKTYLFLHAREPFNLNEQSSTVKPVMNCSTQHPNSVDIKRFRPAPVSLGLDAHVKPGRGFHCMRCSPAVRMHLAASEEQRFVSVHLKGEVRKERLSSAMNSL